MLQHGDAVFFGERVSSRGIVILRPARAEHAHIQASWRATDNSVYIGETNNVAARLSRHR